eukprot:4570701-Amphidinium_carterae.1
MTQPAAVITGSGDGRHAVEPAETATAAAPAANANLLMPDPLGVADRREMQAPPGAQEALASAKRHAERVAEESTLMAEHGDIAMRVDAEEERDRKARRIEALTADDDSDMSACVLSQEVVTEVSEVYCEITGRALDTGQVHAWNHAEMAKIKRLETIGETMTITEAREKGLRVIPTRFMVYSRKEKARLVVQDVRKGPVQIEHFAPTPSLWVLRLVLVIGAQLGYGASVVDISSAFLYAVLPEANRVCITLPAGYGGEKGKCFLVHKSLYGLQIAPSLWATHLGKNLMKLGFVRSKLDAG